MRLGYIGYWVSQLVSDTAGLGIPQELGIERIGIEHELYEIKKTNKTRKVSIFLFILTYKGISKLINV